jgi:hypothetical protein
MNMRTTLDLPADLLRRAKIAAVERGSTLRELVAKALERELGQPEATPSIRPELPLLQVRDDCPVLQLRPEDLKRIDEESEAEKLLEVYRRR